MYIVTETNIKEFPLYSRGKVRDIYKIDEERLLIITTDRMSAFDIIIPEPIPYKGVVLNQMTLFWMRKLQPIIPNHIITDDIQSFPEPLKHYKDILDGRSVLVKKATPLPVECIVRSYLSGSGWKDYLASGEICGHKLQKGLQESAKLQEPIFTPSTKADVGAHDENISNEKVQELIGITLAKKIASLSIQLFNEGSAWAEQHGLIIADTKFEFGTINGELLLIDETFTPDSSRFWSANNYIPGKSQPSFDKQYLRDWFSSQNWDKKSSPPALPKDVIEQTSKKYRDAYTILTGKNIPI